MVHVNTRRAVRDAYDRVLVATAKKSLDAAVTTEAAKFPGAHGQPVPQHLVTALAASVTRSLIESGFVVHDCTSEQRTGGLCRTRSVPAGGVVIAWSVHTALRLDPARLCHGVAANEVMDNAQPDVLHELGWTIDRFGRASDHIVTLQGMAAR